MEFEQAEAVLKKVRYKPGWSFTLVRGPIGIAQGGCLRIRHVEPNARDFSGDSIVINNQEMVNYGQMDEKQFLLTLKSCIQHAEFHELEEFFEFDGQRIWEPHRYDSALR